MEEKKNVNEWHAVERIIFDSKDYGKKPENGLEEVWSELSEIEQHIETEAARAKDLVTRLMHLSRFLDYRSLRDKTGNPYAGNCLLVRSNEMVRLVRRLDDVVPIRYGGAHSWMGRDSSDYCGRGEEIDSILDLNGKLLVRTVIDQDCYETSHGVIFCKPLELEVRQLTDKGEALIRRCDDHRRLDPLDPWDWDFEGAGDVCKELNCNDSYELLETIWDLAEYCQAPRYRERLLKEAAVEYERPLGRKTQTVRVKETYKTFMGEPCFAVIESLDRFKHFTERYDFDTLAEAVAFCKDEYGIEAEV